MRSQKEEEREEKGKKWPTDAKKTNKTHKYGNETNEIWIFSTEIRRQKS